MFERYREDARRAIFFATWEAKQSGSARIETEHMLLGLTHDADSKANKLFNLAAHAEAFRKQLAVPLTGQPVSRKQIDIPLSNASKRVLAYTAEEAYRVGSEPIGTEHLLLGLLREKASDVPAVLGKAEIDLPSARKRLKEDSGARVEDAGGPVEDSRAGAAGGEESVTRSLTTLRALLLLCAVLFLLYLLIVRIATH
jgi:ATP-dependent Clp protease ATP-binding subunit ClpC